MIRNYLKIALRNLLRHKAYSVINIAGLATGMACSILILLWVRQEKSYDRFHAESSNIFRITCAAGDFKAAVNPAGMPVGLKAELPGIRNFVRLSHLTPTLFEAGSNKFQEQNVFYADSSFMTIFSFPVLEGKAATALDRPDAVIITDALAKKYFGNKPALGQSLKRNNSDLVIITAVVQVPENSHLQFDAVMPMSAIAHRDQDLIQQTWGNFNYYTYLLLDKATASTAESRLAFEKNMDRIYQKHSPEFKVNFTLQPLTDIHLYSHLQVDLPGHGNVQYVGIFLVVAIFILVVACINFMNLATARSSRRAREVGVRKVSGALRGQLIRQFLGESVLIAFISLFVAVGLVLLFLPLFNNIAGKRIQLGLDDTAFWSGLVAIAVATGLVAGSYPALFLSGFKPVRVLKGSLRKGGGSLLFRNGLVVTQFIVSIVLLIGTFVVYNQLNFIRSRNMGFDKENLLYMPITGEMGNKIDALKTALAIDPLTSNFTIMDELPTNLISGTVDVKWEGKDPSSQLVFPTLGLTGNFDQVFKMTLLAGRTFSPLYNGDSSNFVVNETALKVMGLNPSTAIGKPMSLWNRNGMIIGVVRDFNFKPVQEPIEPLIMFRNNYGGYVLVRTTPGNTEGTIASLGRISTALNPAYPFAYNFFDQDLANLYRGEQRLGTLFNIFSVLAILISCLGLYGLSAFMAEQRKREIGVRKALGASVMSIVYLLSTGFTKLILLAILISIPLSWFVLNKWLQGFAFHININWIVFLVAAVSALMVAWITVGYESIRAALTNPVTSLRTD